MNSLAIIISIAGTVAVLLGLIVHAVAHGGTDGPRDYHPWDDGEL